jgi:hypothetical protein
MAGADRFLAIYLGVSKATVRRRRLEHTARSE